jgi:hypothetical protein
MQNIVNNKARWTFVRSDNNLGTHYLSKIKIDYERKIISIMYYDVVDFDAVRYFKAFNGRNAKLNNLDGRGNITCSREFDNLSMLCHKIGYDYSKMDTNTGLVKLSFQDTKLLNQI